MQWHSSGTGVPELWKNRRLFQSPILMKWTCPSTARSTVCSKAGFMQRLFKASTIHCLPHKRWPGRSQPFNVLWKRVTRLSMTGKHAKKKMPSANLSSAALHCLTEPPIVSVVISDRISAIQNSGISAFFKGKELNDSGRAAITKNPEELGKFKIGPLRNIALTAPYMHNGMFRTLQEVIGYYDNPDQFVPDAVNRDSLLSRPLNLSARDKEDLENFLKSLTSKALVKNSR